ncbi:endonuclease/exonuclease/phosphatase family protein [Methylobacterium sp.]|jgi:endonuclease/exonuclease/phosphatase (EEP) superfamily protein YafD|uniref:endonuclease/exonuclease/phosphatase family protein n=1 Tax=Methylobacterium sp. TaxID=409 RepID=UPI0025D2574D|nr:endonuclease/exonuclease/phosphatase family protein [Methylobacterium sp.]MBY0257503.1 endonuclease/exonuclease/phosphatase family protein [Methylobacterium sp.]
MTWMAIGLKATGVLLAVATLLPFVPSNSGFIRTFDFPRLQIAALIVPVILGLVLVARDTTGLTLAAALVAALAYQVACIYPFTRLVSPQAVAAEAGASRTEAGVSILIANVLESNRSYGPILDLVVAQDPDLLLLVETDAAWAEALEPLRARYPHVVAQPQDNTYGLMFYSKLPLTDPQVRFLLQDDVPSVRTGVTLRSGQTFTFFGVHPRPPHPGQSSTPRDAELVMVAREVAADGRPAVVAGDLNDVAWSKTNDLFQRISGLLDPRIGRGLYPTFNAKWPLLRWPLDHIFFSDDFLLGRIERLPHIQSDHFPILISLYRTDRAPRLQEAPEATAEDHRAAREAVEAAR